MFHGLTMVNFDGQTQNQMMVRPWSTMVDHGQPWSDGQTVTGDLLGLGREVWIVVLNIHHQILFSVFVVVTPNNYCRAVCVSNVTCVEHVLVEL